MASGHRGGPGRTDDWQLNKSLHETNKHMFEKQLYCDVTFVFKADGKPTENTVSAHRYMLVSRSPVFCAMFEGPVKDESGRVEIDDVDKDSFVDMLRYIYCEETKLSGDSVLTTLYCAKKYMIMGLATLCSEFLERELYHNNVCFILEQAGLFEEAQLQERCLELIDECSQDTVESEGFTGITRGTLESIVRRDTLGLTELDVYKACVRWAEAECHRQHIEATDQNKRTVLGDVVFLIRFPTMDADDFITEVSSGEVLTTEEALNMILLLKGTTPKIPLNFPTIARTGIWDEAFFPSGNTIFANGSNPMFANPQYATPRHSQYIAPFEIRYCQGTRVVIKAVLIINVHNTSICATSIQHTDIDGYSQVTNGKVIKSNNRSHLGHQLYEVALDPPVPLRSGDTASVMFQHFNANNQVTDLQGQRFIGDPNKAGNHGYYQTKQTKRAARLRVSVARQAQNLAGFRGHAAQQAQNFAGYGGFTAEDKFPEDVCIAMKNKTWQYVVGFKYKVTT